MMTRHDALILGMENRERDKRAMLVFLRHINIYILISY